MITFAKAIYGKPEIDAVNRVLKSNWLGNGVELESFEKEFAAYVGRKFCVAVNSGSSANLLALTALELVTGCVLTPAVTFPTTFNPILQLGLLPIVADCDIRTLNIDLDILDFGSLSLQYNVKAMVIPHTLGNVCDMNNVMKIVKKHKIRLIEDCCDALGSTYNGKKVGSWGDLSTYSFYPAHHITMGGEGGAVCTDDPVLARRLRQYRDWGRDCICSNGKDNVCGNRYDYKIGEIDYDHKYVYSKIGYNLKPTEMQCAFGREQLKRVDGFIKKRRANRDYIVKHTTNKLTTQTPIGEPSWFGVAIDTSELSISRKEFMKRLKDGGIDTRLLFAGNILRQPAYQGKPIIITPYQLSGADHIMKHTLFIGCHPGLTKKDLKHIVKTINEAV